MNKELMKQAGFGDYVKDVENNRCPWCKKMINMEHFRNELSKKEYMISGLCQRCQDSFFGVD